MGLSGPRKNTKISTDPRNTRWASNTNRFGHRILESFGWKPGSTLGDITSAHHAHLTSASHTGIKIAVKDDMLGIGAKKGTQDDECTGLDVFQDLLGRLNGKAEEEVEKCRDAREKTRRVIWVDKRYKMKFVLGEVYKSSDIEKLLKRREDDVEQERERARVKDIVKVEIPEQMEGPKAEPCDAIRKNLKKRKIKEGIEGEGKKAKKKRRSEYGEMTKQKRDKRDMKEAKEVIKREKNEMIEVTGLKLLQSSGVMVESNETILKSRGSKEKSSKKQKPEEGRKKKKGRRAKETKMNQESSPENSNNVDEPQAAVTAAARALTGRQAIRHKYIAAKRGAVMDAQALNEILMIKA